MPITADVDRPLTDASDRELEAILARGSDRFRAVEAVAEVRRRPSPSLVARLCELVTSRSGDAAARWTAAVALADQADPDRREALAKALEDPEPEVVRRAAQGLGRIGDQASLKRLETETAYSSPVVQRAVAFARVLLSYRLSVGSHRLVAPPASDLLSVDKTVPFRRQEVSAEQIARALAGLQKRTPGVAVGQASAFLAQCVGDQLLVLLAEEIEKVEDLRSFDRDIVLGLVLSRSSEDGFKLSEYLLAHPGDDGHLIFGVTPMGVVVHFGHFRVEPDGASFEIRAVNTVHGPPIDIAGTYKAADQRIELTRAEVNLRFAVGQKQPVMLQRPRQLRALTDP